MQKNSIERKHYSLGIIFSIFIISMASIVAFTLYNKNLNTDTDFQSKIKEIGYGKVEAINPFVLEKSENTLDKTTMNIELVQEIKRVYNINVIYGENTKYLAESVDAKTLYNEQDINKMLLELIDNLSKYPSNIFKEIQLKDYDVEICIVDYFTNDNIALATRDSNNNFKIYLSNVDRIESIEKSIHHEMYHILEYYMKLEFDINKLYEEWNSYNPKGFEYQENLELLDTSYVYKYDKEDRTYFVSIYSKVSDKEDRAEVFADTMMADEKPSYYTDNLGAIKNKMYLIANAIKNSFYSVNYGTSIYWTRFF